VIKDNGEWLLYYSNVLPITEEFGLCRYSFILLPRENCVFLIETFSAILVFNLDVTNLVETF
jgi:hypothetical protein